MSKRYECEVDPGIIELSLKIATAMDEERVLFVEMDVVVSVN